MQTLEVIRTDRKNVLSKLVALNQDNLRKSADDHYSRKLKVEAAIEFAEICGKEVWPRMEAFNGAELTAADNVDANLQTLSGTMVSQRALELFRIKYPFFSRVYTDFSEEPGYLGQTINTRIVVVPPTMDYDPMVNAQTGLPNGWSFVTPPQATDVNFKLSRLLGVPTRFGLDILSATARKLWVEQAGGMSYAIAKAFVQTVYALFTPNNYNAYAAINGAKVPAAYPSLGVGLGDFARSTLTRIGAIFDPNEMPEENRCIVLNTPYYNQLTNDPSINEFYAALRDEEIITKASLPMLAGFMPIKAPDLPANGVNLIGMALHRAGVALSARPPQNLNDFFSQGAGDGNYILVTDPETKLTFAQMDAVNQTNGFAQRTLAAVIGAGVGDKRGGLCLVGA